MNDTTKSSNECQEPLVQALPAHLHPEAPLLALLGKTISTMSADELKAHVSDLRALRTSAQTFQATLKPRKDAAKTKAIKDAAANVALSNVLSSIGLDL